MSKLTDWVDMTLIVFTGLKNLKTNKKQIMVKAFEQQKKCLKKVYHFLEFESICCNMLSTFEITDREKTLSIRSSEIFIFFRDESSRLHLPVYWLFYSTTQGRRRRITIHSQIYQKLNQT